MAARTEPMRERIPAAAVKVVRARGIVAATTKEIARGAGVSEGRLHDHFANRTALFAAALAEVTGTARAAMTPLLGTAGRNTVAENLARLAADMVRLHGDPLPMTGPVLGHFALIGYLEAERRAGRIRNDAPCRSWPPPSSGAAGSTPSSPGWPARRQ